MDGFVFHAAGGLVRTDIRTPAWKFLAETDVILRIKRLSGSRIPSISARGRSPAPRTRIGIWLESSANWRARDLPPRPDRQPCEPPDTSRVPSRLVQDAVYDWMKLWIERGTPPPHAPPIVMSSVGTRGAAGPNDSPCVRGRAR